MGFLAWLLIYRLLIFPDEQPESYPVQILDFDSGVFLKVFAERDNHIEAAAREIVVIAPYPQENIFPAQHLAGMDANRCSKSASFWAAGAYGTDPSAAGSRGRSGNVQSWCAGPKGADIGNASGILQCAIRVLQC